MTRGGEFCHLRVILAGDTHGELGRADETQAVHRKTARESSACAFWWSKTIAG